MCIYHFLMNYQILNPLDTYKYVKTTYFTNHSQRNAKGAMDNVHSLIMFLNGLIPLEKDDQGIKRVVFLSDFRRQKYKMKPDISLIMDARLISESSQQWVAAKKLYFPTAGKNIRPFNLKLHTLFTYFLFISDTVSDRPAYHLTILTRQGRLRPETEATFGHLLTYKTLEV